MISVEAITSHSVVFYDGECGLCHRVVQWVWQHDPEGVFHFLALQSPEAAELLAEYGEIQLDTVIVAHEGVFTTKSEAVMTLLKVLPRNRWTQAGRALQVFSPTFRDRGYELLARHRHRFPLRSNCALPPPEVRARFL